MIYFSLPGGMELVVIVLIVLLLFGGKKIPEMMRGLGSGIREFKKAQSDISDEINKAIKEDPKEKSDDK